MAIDARINALYTKHMEIEKLIQEAYTSHCDDVVLGRLKKQKLMLKEEISQLEAASSLNQQQHRNKPHSKVTKAA